MAEYTLPGHNELLRRLMRVSNDPTKVQRFYPHILEYAGRRLEGPGIASVLVRAATEYASGLPPTAIQATNMTLPLYVEAIVDSERVKAEIYDVFHELGIA